MEGYKPVRKRSEGAIQNVWNSDIRSRSLKSSSPDVFTINRDSSGKHAIIDSGSSKTPKVVKPRPLLTPVATMDEFVANDEELERIHNDLNKCFLEYRESVRSSINEFNQEPSKHEPKIKSNPKANGMHASKIADKIKETINPNKVGNRPSSALANPIRATDVGARSSFNPRQPVRPSSAMGDANGILPTPSPVSSNRSSERSRSRLSSNSSSEDLKPRKRDRSASSDRSRGSSTPEVTRDYQKSFSSTTPARIRPSSPAINRSTNAVQFPADNRSRPSTPVCTPTVSNKASRPSTPVNSGSTIRNRPSTPINNAPCRNRPSTPVNNGVSIKNRPSTPVNNTVPNRDRPSTPVNSSTSLRNRPATAANNSNSARNRTTPPNVMPTKSRPATPLTQANRTTNGVRSHSSRPSTPVNHSQSSTTKYAAANSTAKIQTSRPSTPSGNRPSTPMRNGSTNSTGNQTNSRPSTPVVSRPSRSRTLPKEPEERSKRLSRAEERQGRKPAFNRSQSQNRYDAAHSNSANPPTKFQRQRSQSVCRSEKLAIIKTPDPRIKPRKDDRPGKTKIPMPMHFELRRYDSGVDIHVLYDGAWAQ